MTETFLCETFYTISTDKKSRARINGYVKGGTILAGLFDLLHFQYVEMDKEKIYLRHFLPISHPFLEKLRKHLALMPNGYVIKEYMMNFMHEWGEARPLLIEELIRKGVVNKQKKKFLKFFSYETITLVDESIMDEIKRQVRHYVLYEKKSYDYLNYVLLLISICQMEELFFSFSELAIAKKHIASFIESYEHFRHLPIKELHTDSIAYVGGDVGDCSGGDGGGSCS